MDRKQQWLLKWAWAISNTTCGVNTVSDPAISNEDNSHRYCIAVNLRTNELRDNTCVNGFPALDRCQHRISKKDSSLNGAS